MSDYASSVIIMVGSWNVAFLNGNGLTTMDSKNNNEQKLNMFDFGSGCQNYPNRIACQ